MNWQTWPWKWGCPKKRQGAKNWTWKREKKFRVRHMERTRFTQAVAEPQFRTPNFDSGIISEPLLMFGGGHKHVDPKTGLALYGPYSLQGHTRGPLRSI